MPSGRRNAGIKCIKVMVALVRDWILELGLVAITYLAID